MRGAVVGATLAVVGSVACQQAPVSPDRAALSAAPSAEVEPARGESTAGPAPSSTALVFPDKVEPPPHAEPAAVAPVDAGPWRGQVERCPRPVSVFCRGPCPTFASARTRVGGDDAGPYNPDEADPLCAYRVHVGQCGAFRYVRSGDCLAGELLIFDPQGRLVGVSGWTDVAGHGVGCYGEVPDPCP